jgi:hypothetical protein
MTPPMPRLNGVSILASAPPLALSTTPNLRFTTRIPWVIATAVAASQSRPTSARKPVPGRLSSVSISSPRLP